MSHLLTRPTAILVLGPRQAAQEPLATAIATGGISETIVVGDVPAAITRIESRSDVGCIVIAAPPAETTVLDACKRLHELDDQRPIVLALESPSIETVSSATRAGVEAVVADPDDLPAELETAVDRYDRRRQMAAESSLFQTLMDGFDGALYAKDHEARHLMKSVSQGDYDPDDFVGKTDIDMYGDSVDTRESVRDDLSVIEAGEPLRNKEARFTAADGTHWSRTTKLPWRMDGDVVGLVGWTRDVTEEVQRRKRLAKKDEEFEQFVRSVKHDVKNPLQVATGMISIARQTESIDRLDKAQTALERIEEILGDLSEVQRGRVEHGEDALVTELGEPTVLQELVENVWDLVGVETATLETTFDPAVVTNAPGASLRPVLENLLKNSVEHGGADVTIRVGLIETGGLYVADDGPGIPEDERERVLDDGFTTAVTGTGTGLSIVSDIAENRGWRVNVTDSWAGGTRVELTNVVLLPDPTVATPSDETLPLADGTDVGAVNVTGSSEYDPDADRWHLEGAGLNIYRSTNEFHYRYRAIDGPFRLQGRVTSLDGENDTSTVGLMLRDGLGDDVPYAYIGLTDGRGTSLDWRPVTDSEGTCHYFECDTDSPWYRIDRVGETVTVSESADGETFRAIDQRRVDLSDPVCAGLAICSVQPGRPITAAVDDVTLGPLDVG